MIRVLVEHITDTGTIVSQSITIDVQKRHGVADCHARIDAAAGHRPMLREVDVSGVPDGAGALWVVGEVIRRAHAFAAEAPEREY